MELAKLWPWTGLNVPPHLGILQPWPKGLWIKTVIPWCHKEIAGSRCVFISPMMRTLFFFSLDPSPKKWSRCPIGFDSHSGNLGMGRTRGTDASGSDHTVEAIGGSPTSNRGLVDLLDLLDCSLPSLRIFPVALLDMCGHCGLKRSYFCHNLRLWKDQVIQNPPSSATP